ncbi:Rv3654c family TadE-like protein [Streptomyces montanisoli]|uniref:Flp pilus-assembly TadE/G-like family protein n=1 Tax=Streptomyces montanisoli TaxID=2798581 RepID=A0A940MAJ7_9ACTN|nr:Rv3654c family TadE-like protein [Streptomyces montanisoli]MBP0456500.1 flp pilus-assembly TadE/G-like family protein [Streptomyces montanisoli]
MSGRRRSEGDRGYATVVTAVAATVLCALFGVVLALGEAVVARHRAEAAADLAALAAADRAPAGRTAACRGARTVAGAQGARLVRCVLDGQVAEVTAAVRAGPYEPTALARAGPGLTASPGTSSDPAGPPAPEPPGGRP